MTTGRLDLAARAEREAVPLTVTVELTRRCNYRCRHCYVPDLGAPEQVPTARLLLLLEELAEAGTLFLGLTGGEPLARRDWSTLARRARDLGFAVELLTNGALVDDHAARTLAELHAHVSVSLHSMDPATFEAVSGVPGSLRLTLAGIERLRAHGVDVLLKVPLTTLNADAAESVSAYARSLGAEFEAYSLLTCRLDGDPSPLALRLPPAPAAGQLRWLETAACSPGSLSGLVVGEDDTLCAAGTRAAHVTASGDVLACIDLPTPAGNLLVQPFREIWDGSPWLARLRALRRRDLRICGECAKLAFCGRCHAQALKEDGDLLGPSSWACEHALAIERLGLRSPTRT